MKLNRKWLMVIALVMSMAMATTGTLAFLTDRDTEVNTFTMGNVDIEVEEEYDQYAPLLPGVEVDKLAGIKNVHKTSDAWVWMTVSVPTALKDYIELSWSSDDVKTEAEANVVTDVHDGYTSYVVKYAKELAPGESTPKYLQGVTLSEKVDYQDGQYVVIENGEIIATIGNLSDVNVIVDGFAMQTEGFETVSEAYEAYVEQWDKLGNGGESGADSGEGVQSKYIYTADQLAAALQTGGDYIFANDITTDGDIQAVAEGVTLTLDMNGKTLNGAISVPASASLTAKNGSLVNNNDEVSGIETTGTVVLDNVNVTSARHAVRVEGGTTTINSGEYKIESSGKTQHAVNVSDGGEVIINGGTFIGPKGTTADSGSAVTIQAGSTGTINGGDFSMGKNSTLSAKGTLTVYGGTFDQDPSTFVAAGYTANENNGTWTIGKNPPTGTVTYGYTAVDKIWGEAKANATESLVVKVYSSNTYMGETSLKNINGIIDGDVYVTWNLKLDAGSNTDSYWSMSWENPPTKDMHATKVELWVDGTKVAENAAKMNAPDNLKKITKAVIDSNGTVLEYGYEGYTFTKVGTEVSIN